MNAQILDPFYPAFRGRFSSCLKWEHLTELWDVVKRDAEKHWYIYAINESVPAFPASHKDLHRFVDEIDKLLHQDHDEDYCGIVYVDNKTEPTFIKIYDPNNLGVVCGFSHSPPLPGWTLSVLPPKSLSDGAMNTAQRKRWWQKFM